MLASESVALDHAGGFRGVRDIAPGQGRVHRRGRAACTRSNAYRPRRHTPCIFESVYFARPDSIIDNISGAACAHAHGRAASPRRSNASGPITASTW
jgi:amidophosphoribosyltransferase